MKSLTVLYDAECAFCRRCRRWLEAQPQLVTLRFLPRAAPRVKELFPMLEMAGDDAELILVSDEGAVYRDDKAYLMCLWALREYRSIAIKLATPKWRGLARRAFAWLANGRSWLSRFFESDTAVIDTIRLHHVDCACRAMNQDNPGCPNPDRHDNTSLHALRRSREHTDRVWHEMTRLGERQDGFDRRPPIGPPLN